MSREIYCLFSIQKNFTIIVILCKIENGDIMKNKIQDIEVKNKRVLLRADLNVPMHDGVILDDSKIVASLKTIEYLIHEGAKIIILSHFGKIKTEEDKKTNSLAPVANYLQKLLNKKVISEIRSQYKIERKSKRNFRNYTNIED